MKNKDLINGDIPATLRSMTVPMILGMIMLMTFSLVDTYFVSQLGTLELAAISFTFPVTFTVISLTIGLGIGASAIIGKFMGSGDTQHAKVVGTGAILITVILVSVLSLIGYVLLEPIFIAMGADSDTLPFIRDYMTIWFVSGVFLSVPMVGNSILRANGDTKTPSLIMAGGGAINAILDPVLIFGLGPVPALGIQGAAIATAVAWAVGVVWIMYLLIIKRQLIEPKWLSFKEFKEASAGVLNIGVPAAGANMLTPIAAAVMTAVVAGYGNEAVAAWGVGNRLESLASIIVLALSMSLPPFISQNFGANKWGRIEQAYAISLKFVLAWQLIMFAVVAMSAHLLAEVFAETEEVRSLIVLFLFIVPLGYGLQGVIILTNSSFNAMHAPRQALWLSIIRLFLCYIPIAYLGSLLFDLVGLFWGCVIANALTAFISYIWFKRYLNEQHALYLQVE